MAFRVALHRAAGGSTMSALGLRRWAHITARPPLLDGVINNPATPSPQSVLPEIHQSYENSDIGFEFPSFSFGGGSMELLAVPKKKVSPHKKGIRNGPKALKPVPVIIRCKICGRVKLPHFFCCGGDRGNTGGENGSSS